MSWPLEAEQLTLVYTGSQPVDGAALVSQTHGYSPAEPHSISTATELLRELFLFEIYLQTRHCARRRFFRRNYIEVICPIILRPGILSVN